MHELSWNHHLHFFILDRTYCDSQLHVQFFMDAEAQPSLSLSLLREIERAAVAFGEQRSSLY